ncbi:hypothetical protein [Paenibacillus taiwanensis]|uniref:hypothetical protein n=1 Tax=Paenibacillus taiwanensis TaxID=401638 RepID=UPI00040C6D88|nr:hypothetical protein [Paenibacillus taiwanensis]
MKKKSYLCIIVSICVMFLVSACTSNEEKVAAIKSEVDALEEKGQYKEAIIKFEEILKISDEDSYKRELTKKKKQLEDDQKLINKLSEYRKLLLSIQRDKLAKTKKEITYVDLHYILNDIKPMYDEISTIKADRNRDVKMYVKKLVDAQSLTQYTMPNLFTEEYATSVDAARRLDLPGINIGGEIGSMLDDIKMLDQMSKDLHISAVDQYVEDILDVPVPNSLNI